MEPRKLLKAAVQTGFKGAGMEQPLAGRTFWELLGRQLPTALGQRTRNGSQLFQAAGIYFECFEGFKNHTSFGVHTNVK